MSDDSPNTLADGSCPVLVTCTKRHIRRESEEEEEEEETI
jgi:hypothetical protein